MSERKRIAVIGGGASGMMAAITAAKLGANVTLYEHTDRVGKKLLATGNGRCNFTNAKLSKEDYKGGHPSFVESALRFFDEKSAVAFFEEAGMLTVSKRDGYYYPYSGQASTVLNILRLMLDESGVTVITQCNVHKLERDEKKNVIRLFIEGKKDAEYDSVILACGGKALPASGSDGSGYTYAKQLGHRLIKPLPALTFLTSREACLKELAGVRTQGEAVLYCDGKELLREEGELQFNKTNLSGIPVFQLSHEAIKALDKRRRVSLVINFLPQLSKEACEQFLDGLQKNYPKQTIETALCGMLNKKIVGALLHKAQLKYSMKMQDLSIEECKSLAALMQAFPFEIDGHGDFAAAQVTMGGVDVDEISECMMSKLAKNVYIIGEMLDVDGICGGYNLQWAWTSGYIAGCHSATGEIQCYESHNAK